MKAKTSFALRRSFLSQFIFVLVLLGVNAVFCMENFFEETILSVPPLDEQDYSLGTVEDTHSCLYVPSLSDVLRVRVLNLKNRIWLCCLMSRPNGPLNPNIVKPTNEELDLSFINLEGGFFGGVNLFGVNLQRACLKSVYFVRAHLEYAKLQGACLYGADLRYANMRYSDMHDVDLQYTRLLGANLEGVVGLTELQKMYARLAGAINVPE